MVAWPVVSGLLSAKRGHCRLSFSETNELHVRAGRSFLVDIFIRINSIEYESLRILPFQTNINNFPGLSLP